MATEVVIKDGRVVKFGDPLVSPMEKKLDAFLMGNATFARYPNGNGGWEQRRGGKTIIELAKHFAESNGMTMEYIPGNAWATSSCILRPA